jgi:hypothetical protein
LDEIFETLKQIDLLLMQNQKRVGKLYEQIKFARLDRNVLGAFNNNNNTTLNKSTTSLNAVESADNQDASTTARQRLLDLTNNKLKRDLSSAHVTDLSTQMCSLDLDQQGPSGESSSSAKLRSDMERSSRFYAQLYELLGKRKQLPVQHANFDVLSAFDDVGYTEENNLVLSGESTTAHRNNNLTLNQVNEASFMNFKTATPLQQQYQQSPLIQQQQQIQGEFLIFAFFNCPIQL